MPSAQTIKSKNQKDSNIIPKQGNKKEEKLPVGPILLGVFLFVVVGSALFQIFSVASNRQDV